MILVTGASGLLGSTLVLSAVEREEEVAGIYGRHRFCSPGATAHGVDLTDFNAARMLLLGLRPRAIIHCAAATNVDWCEEHPEEARQINVCASQFLAELATEMGSKFVYVSTDSVFDGTRSNYSENDAPAPVNVYAQTKLDGEQRVMQAHASSLIVRVNFYGWNVQPKQSLAEWVLTRLRQAHKVPGFTDVHFCPMLAGGLAEIIFMMIDHDLRGIFHVVGRERISKYEFARHVATTFGFDAEQVLPTQLADARLRAPRPRDTSLNTEKVSRALGRSMPDIDSGLRRLCDMRQGKDIHGLQGCTAGADI